MEEKDLHAELISIRQLMERSAKFVSLTGLSGVMAGIYALAGSWFMCRILDSVTLTEFDQTHIFLICAIAMIVLVLSLLTALLLTIHKARKKGDTVWNPVSRRFAANLFIPLVTGGIFMLALLFKEQYALISPVCLIFYGLSLVSASHYAFTEVKWMGLSNIALGLFAVVFPAYGLILWAAGFGVLHIAYGSFMYFKYDR